ncbi:MAG: DNA-binding response regulator [Chloroflexi bacterium HGW-Chloroflexi-2]|nr:MAG: DNA-binding response regulator [Chloroflexi bacterium HGW-Chloroflexi-2]
MGKIDKLPDITRIVIVDDHALFRDGLATILDVEDDLEVVGQGGSAEEAIQLTKDLTPDIILLDLDMPGGGLKAASVISNEMVETKIVVLTASEEDNNLLNALKIGAQAYILKGVAARELLRILRMVIDGENYVPPALAASMLLEMNMSKTHPKKEVENPIDSLTGREKEILEGLAKGLSNKEIGENLFLSEKTVKHYITIILQKLQVRNRVEAALLAQKRELDEE